MNEKPKRESAIIVKGNPQTEGPRTYIVFGVMRGGTTMVAGIMGALGISMGNEVDENNQEFTDLNNSDLNRKREIIATMNEAYQVWGWKHPNAADYIDRIWSELRNPHLICVFRDSVANGQGLNRWHPFGQVQAMQESLLRQQKNLNLLALRNAPSVLISYEKAERHKALFLEEFSSLLGIEPDHSKFDFEGFMQASSYKRLEDFRRSS